MVGIVSIVGAVGIWIASRGWWAGLKERIGDVSRKDIATYRRYDHKFIRIATITRAAQALLNVRRRKIIGLILMVWVRTTGIGLVERLILCAFRGKRRQLTILSI